MNGTRATLPVLALCLPLTSAAESLTGKVVGVTHSDTITVLVAERPIKIRLAEIDTPERGQPWATRVEQAVGTHNWRQQVSRLSNR